jgi:hypothetical protein
LKAAAVLAAVGLLLAAGCSSDDGDDAPSAGGPATTASSGTTSEEGFAVPVDGGTADPEPGRILLSFVRAAARGDAKAMWDLLSEPTRASIGPTFADFRTGAAVNLEMGLGTLAPNAEVILSRRLEEDWAVAAIAGDRTVEGEREHYAYGAALLPEDGSLKLELGGVVISGYKPEPLQEIDERRPELAANVGAGGDLSDVRMWLDGEPFEARRGANDTPFTATLRGRPEQPLTAGEHEVVVFAATSETATASAWSFTVK